MLKDMIFYIYIMILNHMNTSLFYRDTCYHSW